MGVFEGPFGCGMRTMDRWADIEPEALLTGQGDWLDANALTTLASHPLDCIDRQFPHYAHSVEAVNDVDRPVEEHPVFYGCYDWHSAVHSHWSLVRQLRLYEDHPEATTIRNRLADRFTRDAVQAEVDYLTANRTFERPYGWAWLLRLAAELALATDDEIAGWRAILNPLETQVMELVETEFLTQDRPLRVGTHGNSAFALGCVIDYARVTNNGRLEAYAAATARSWYGDDRRWPLEYEPLGWDFLSPGLVEEDLMRRVLARDAFLDWLDGFRPVHESPATIAELAPVSVASTTGPELHLAGLNLSRAWCLAGIAAVFPADRGVEAVERSAVRHAQAGLADAFTDEYAGAHWLTSFVIYLLTRNAGGIAPA
jgi:hypothetical protein